MRTKFLGIVFCIGITSHLYAQTPQDAFVLLPIYTSPIPGAYGSVWTSYLIVRNDSDAAVPISQLNCKFPCAGPRVLEPHRDTDLSAVDRFVFGRIIHAPAAQIDQLYFNARVKDLSRQEKSAGVEIPVVRQTDLRSRIILLNVPTDVLFRSALRIYDVTGRATTVRLRIFSFDGDAPLVDTIVPLAEPSVSVDNAFPAQSNILDIAAAFPAVRSVTTLRIEIDGSTKTLWAMVSTTNNESQEVTIVTPH